MVVFTYKAPWDTSSFTVSSEAFRAVSDGMPKTTTSSILNIRFLLLFRLIGADTKGILPWNSEAKFGLVALVATTSISRHPTAREGNISAICSRHQQAISVILSASDESFIVVCAPT